MCAEGNEEGDFSFFMYATKNYAYAESALTNLWRALSLKVFTNEKRGGFRVISFDRPPFKLLSRKFSKESVQAPSWERHKTTQRTLVSITVFANNY